VEPREQQLVQTFISLTDTLVADFDAEELLHVLAARCVELLGVDAAGVMLAMGTNELQAAAASSRDMRQLEIFEVASAEGPSYDAYVSGEVVLERDLRTATSRWPMFTPRALELGFVVAYGFPLRLRERTVGALNLFQVEGRVALDDPDLAVAQGFADVATIALLQEQALHNAEALTEQLTGALSSRVSIEQAKGIVAERFGLDPQQAFERLRTHARSRGRKLRDVAQEVIDGSLDSL